MLKLFYGSDTHKTHEVVQSTILPLLRLEGVEVQDKVIPELTD